MSFQLALVSSHHWRGARYCLRQIQVVCDDITRQSMSPKVTAVYLGKPACIVPDIWLWLCLSAFGFSSDSISSVLEKSVASGKVLANLALLIWPTDCYIRLLLFFFPLLSMWLWNMWFLSSVLVYLRIPELNSLTPFARKHLSQTNQEGRLQHWK